MPTAPTRGERNNNAGNVRLGDNWQGLADVQTDPAFCQFKAPIWGLRACAVLLLAYYHKHGLNTVRKLIDRWAPPVENNTSAYVTDVAARLRVEPDAPLAVDNIDTLAKLVSAIVSHENGRNIYAPTLIYNACEMALGHQPSSPVAAVEASSG